MDSSPEYEYRSREGDDIRVVELFPAEREDDPIRLRVVHHALTLSVDEAQSEAGKEDGSVGLPRGWQAYRTPEGRWFYHNEHDTDGGSIVYTRPGIGSGEEAEMMTSAYGLLTTSTTTYEADFQFEALSYTWGEAMSTSIVLVVAGSGLSSTEFTSQRQSFLPITSNLDVALRHLRLTHRSRFLWIDALCINQKDLVERSAQVLRMRDIYGLASRVIVWLGPASEDSERALEILRHLGEQYEISDDTSLFPASLGSSPEWRWFDIQRILPYSEHQWRAIEQLFSRPWFERL